MTAYKWFVISNGIAVLVILHEEDVSDVQFPCLVLGAELSTLSEDFLDHIIVALIPEDLSLHHEHRNILIESLIVFLQCRVDGFRVTGETGILDGLSLLTKGVNVLGGKVFEFAIRFFL